MKKISIIAVFSIITLTTFSQSKNLIIITIDGLRWQEVFKGVDLSLANQNYLNNPNYKLSDFNGKDSIESRMKIMPFLWSVIKNNGQIWGNRSLGNLVEVANQYWFSYPGYNEMLCGFADPKINSNNLIYNENINIFEYLQNINPAKYKDKIGIFTVWNGFEYILNKKRNGLYVVNGADSFGGTNPNSNENYLNFLKFNSLPFGLEKTYYNDIYALTGAFEYLKKQKPNLLYIAVTETDYYGHQNDYPNYLLSVNKIDKFIAQLWNYLQSDPNYKDNTTLFINTDHGRGIGANWTSHYYYIPRSNETWFAVIGPNIPPKGEVNIKIKITQNQFANTFAKILGTNFTLPGKNIAPPIEQIFIKKTSSCNSNLTSPSIGKTLPK
ncbi:MAG: alkaline phosphatase family protein [Sediminibacterium sp.]|nr:alkaline phosphatase family protein [Sediminibacterium sp.]